VGTITYRITYADGTIEMATVQARTINSGFAKAVRIANEPLGNGTRREIHSAEFWNR
jgi:hypothetical protein